MKNTYEYEVWFRAVRDAEGDVMRVCPTLVGGRHEGESVEKYVKRCRAALDSALERLAIAQRNLSKVTPKDSLKKAREPREHGGKAS